MRFDRASGVFCHPTSLPGDGGIGSLGDHAERFVDWLADAGQTYWQICPLGPTSGAHGNSPYQSYSAFAGNPDLVSLERLREQGWLTDGDLADAPAFDRDSVEYDRVRAFKRDRLRTAFERFEATAGGEQRRAFEAFREAERDWLDDYALFMALKSDHDGAWTDWPEGLKLRDADALAAARKAYADEIRFRKFAQFCFDRQWRDLKAYANDHGISLVGDLPIYVALDSADVWASPESFQLDADNEPEAVAGVPSFVGDPAQKWGNPLYDWEALADDGYAWWVRRFERLFETVDVARIDHFRGFVSYWRIPADAPADEGEWVEGPGTEFFRAVEAELGDLPLVVEDLGFVSEDVERVRDELDVPGMKVLQYADWCADDHMYLPHTYRENCVAYSGTHDTNTTRGWYEGLDDEQRECLHYYLDTDGEEVHWDVMAAAWESDAVLALAPLQDALGLGGDARFNTPGTAEGNWDWRFREGDLDADLAARLRELTAWADRKRAD